MSAYVDGAGYNNQSVIHTILPESIGKLVEITNALSSDEQLDSTFTRSDLVEVNNPLINPDEKEYKLAYNNHISLLFLCDKNETVKQVLIGSTEMGYRELFYDYIDIFYRIAGINKPEEMAYYLAALYGDSFTWENMIRHIVSYNGLRIKCSSFIIDGWAIDFTYDLSGIPQMMIYKGTLISRSFPYYSN